MISCVKCNKCPLEGYCTLKDTGPRFEAVQSDLPVCVDCCVALGLVGANGAFVRPSERELAILMGDSAAEPSEPRHIFLIRLNDGVECAFEGTLEEAEALKERLKHDYQTRFRPTRMCYWRVESTELFSGAAAK